MSTRKIIEEEKADAALRERFALNVRFLRVQKGLSQEELAARSGLHRTFVSDVEREIRNVALSNIGKLARALDVDVSELFARIDASIREEPLSLPKGPKRNRIGP
jgi:transcriptional regulator with XRE-family HTH domain